MSPATTGQHSTSGPVQRVLERLDGVRRSGDGWTARCPAHDDRDPSLSVAGGGDGRALLRCHAGCATEDVVRALRLSMRDLMPEPRARSSRRRREQEYVICDVDGQPVAVHVRTGGGRRKRMWWRRPDGSHGLGGVRTRDLPVYRAETLAAIDAAPVLMTEGERAAAALAPIAAQIGVGVVGTVTGASACPSVDVLRALAGRAVYVWPDHDDAGRAHMVRVAAGLRRAGVADVRVVTWPGATDAGDDAADWVARGGTVEALRELLAAAPAAPATTPAAGHDDDGDAESADDVDAARESAATRAIELAHAAGVEPWHDDDGDAYIDVRDRGGPRRTMHVRSRACRQWLAGIYYRSERRAIGDAALSSALGVLAAEAVYDGPIHPVHVRIADGSDGAVYLDLADETWRAVRVTPDGWDLIDDPPVRFGRTRVLRPLPEPVRGGHIDELRRVLHVTEERDWILLVAWLVGALSPCGPYPILTLTGEHGAAKSTTARIVRSLVDPSAAPLSSPPREERDLLTAARCAHIIALDNLTHIEQWLSDALCRLATGGGVIARELYTDGEPYVFGARRPIILTSIEDVAVRGDLADRAIPVCLAPIDDADRRLERELDAALDEIAPRVLGALLDAVATGLRRRDEVRLARLPRMADYATWVVACEPALPWADGAFVAAYTEARESITETAVDADPVATAIVALLDADGEWTGTAADLLAALDRHRGDARPPRGWPTTASAMGGRLRRSAPLLRGRGIDVEHGRTGRRRWWRIDRHPRHHRHISCDHTSIADDGTVTVVTVPRPAVTTDRHADSDVISAGCDGRDGGDARAQDDGYDGRDWEAEWDPADLGGTP